MRKYWLKNFAYSLVVCMVLGMFTGITVLAASTYYIDPSYQVSPRDGSIDHPFNSWSEVTMTAGNTYLQKRGTTATVSAKVSLKSNVTMGAYGTGARPIFNSTVTSPDKAIDIPNCVNTVIQDFEVTAPNAVVCINVGGTSSNNITVNNCVIHDSQWGIRLTLQWNEAHILNTEIYNTKDDGLFAQDVSGLEIAYCYVHDINQNYNIVGHSQIVAAGDCVQLDRCDNYNIHNNLLDHSATGNKFAVITKGNTSTGVAVDGVIENNHLIGQTLGPDGGAGIYLEVTDGVIVRNNIIENSFYACYGGNAVTNTKFYNNIVNNNQGGFSLPANFNLEIYNNTFYNSYINLKDNGGSGSLASKNNIFEVSQTNDKVYTNGNFTTQGNFVSNYNLVYPEKTNFITYNNANYSTLAAWASATGRDANSINTSPQFTDVSKGDFRIGRNSPAMGSGTVITGITGDAPVNMGADAEALYNTQISVNASKWLLPSYVSSPMATPPAPLTLVGSIANWDLNENSGSTASDTSDNGNNGTITGASWATGKYGSALDFNGTSNYVSCGTNSLLNMGSNNFTFAAWIKPDTTATGWNTIIGGNVNSASFGLSNGKLRFTKVNVVDATDSGVTISTGVWTHVAVTFDSSATTNNLKYYVNGNLVNTVSFNYDFSDISNLIGIRKSGSGYFDGIIDDAKIFNSVLSATDVSELAQ